MDKKTRKRLDKAIDELKYVRYAPSVVRGRLSTHDCPEFSRGYAWGIEQAAGIILQALGDSELLDDWRRAVEEVRKLSDWISD